MERVLMSLKFETQQNSHKITTTKTSAMDPGAHPPQDDNTPLGIEIGGVSQEQGQEWGHT